MTLSKLDKVYIDFTNNYLNSLITLSNVIYHIYMTFFLLHTWKTPFFLERNIE